MTRQELGRRLLIGAVLLTVIALWRPHIHNAGWVFEDDAVWTMGNHPWTGRRLITALSYRLSRDWGPTPQASHAVNLALHLTTTFAVGALALELGLSPHIAGSLFLLQPVAGEAVAYGLGRGDLLMTLGCVLAALGARRRRGWLAAVGVLLAIGAKEIGVISVILVWWAWPRPFRFKTRQLLLALVCAAVGIGSMIYIVSPASLLSLIEKQPISWWRWTTLAAVANWHWLGVSLVPLPQLLTLEQNWLVVPPPIATSLWLAWMAVGGALVLRRPRTTLMLAGGWIWLSLALRLVIPTPEQFLTGRLMYLTVVGVVLAVAAWAEDR